MISIIIPFYDNKEWLYEAVDSVLKQTYKNYELIVINDGGSSIRKDLLRKYGDNIQYFYQENKGPGAARNFGIGKSKGDYIAFLDSDDIWHPEKLRIQFEFMTKNKCIWSHTNYRQFYNNNINNYKSYKLDKFSGKIFPQILFSSHIATPSVMIEAKFFRENQEFRFNENMRFGQDYYLWVLLSKYTELFLVNEELTYVRISGNNASKRAKAHLQVRSNFWMELKEKKSTGIFYGYKFAFLFRTLYKTVKVMSYISLRISNKFASSPKQEEIISRICYTLPYFSFKLFHFLYGIILKPRKQI